jgi:hypothetical protein
MARTLVGLVIGIVLIFPGIELIRWLATSVFQVYPDMTLTEASLAVIIIMQAIILARGSRRSGPPGHPPELYLTGPRVKPPTLRPRPPRRPARPKEEDRDDSAVQARRRRAARRQKDLGDD